MNKIKHIQTDTINTKNRSFILKHSITLDIEYSKNIIEVRHATLPINGYGNTEQEALDELFETFDIQYRFLVESTEDSLTPGALKKRKLLQNIVSRIDENTKHHER